MNNHLGSDQTVIASARTAKDQTGFAVLTAAGRSAIATIVVHGPDAISIVDQLFRPLGRTNLSPKQQGDVVYGHWLVDGKPSEDLIVCPKSSDLCEIHCHGGETASELIGRTLQQHGAIPLPPTELTSRMYRDPLRADLEFTLSKAKTPRIVRMLLDQIESQPQFWQRIRDYVQQGDSATAAEMAEDFRKWESFGLRLTSEWRVALCGAPNVGKSSLINAMLGFQRAIVHAEAGTTRDAIDELTAIDGWPIRIFDTAGVRTSQDNIEMQGVELTHQVAGQADLVVLVIDANQPDPLGSIDLLQARPDLIVANKSDLNRVNDSQVDLHVSAKTGSGVPDLMQAIVQKLIPDLPDPGTAIPVSPFQLEFLDSMVNRLA